MPPSSSEDPAPSFSFFLSPFDFFADFFFAVNVSASLSQFFGPLFEEVGYEGALSGFKLTPGWARVLMTAALAAGGSTPNSTSLRGALPSSAGHFCPGTFLRKLTSTFVDIIKYVETDGSIRANRGSNLSMNDEDRSDGCGNET